MNKERLLKLADFLETEVPPRKFDMHYWASGSTCGTAGCAVGWAAQIPEFKPFNYDEEPTIPDVVARIRALVAQEEVHA